MSPNDGRDRMNSTGRPRSTSGEDLVTALLAAWPTVGLYLDGWAHHTRPGMETFFTPWHAVLYSGAAVFGAWLFVLAARRGAGRGMRNRIPAGYGLGFVGLAGFGLAGIADMVWHELFGVEVSLDALLSPSHLLLFGAALLALTCPLRAAWLRPGADEPPPAGRHQLWPSVISLTETTAVTAFFLQFLSPFERGDLVSRADESSAALGVAGILVTTALLVAPLLLFMRGLGRPPFGAVGLHFGTVVGLLQFGHDFPTPAMVVGAVGAGLLVDVLITAVDRAAGQGRSIWWVGALAPVGLWGGYFVVVQATNGVAWLPEVWSGAIVLSALAGLALGLLVFPPEGNRTRPPPG